MLKIFHLNWEKARALDDDRALYFELTMHGNIAYIDDALAAGLYDEVAEVDTDDFDDAYRLTNHIDANWTTNPEVNAPSEKVRSTSVGDLFGPEDGSFHIVAPIGFNKAHFTPRKIA